MMWMRRAEGGATVRRSVRRSRKLLARVSLAAIGAAVLVSPLASQPAASVSLPLDPLDDASRAEESWLGQLLAEGSLDDAAISELEAMDRDAIRLMLVTAPAIEEPERLWPLLARWMAGEDPALAPAAAMAAWTIGERLEYAEFSAGERGVDPAWVPAFEEIAADTSVRGDIRAVAQAVAQRITSLTVPEGDAPPSEEG